MSKPKEIKIEKDGLVGEVTEEALPTWEEHGWTVVDDGSSESSEAGSPEPVEVQPDVPQDQLYLHTDDDKE